MYVIKDFVLKLSQEISEKLLPILEILMKLLACLNTTKQIFNPIYGSFLIRILIPPNRNSGIASLINSDFIGDQWEIIQQQPTTLENVKGEFESFGELLSVCETGTESSFHR